MSDNIRINIKLAFIIIILILFVISMNYYKKIRRQRYKPYLGEIKALKRRLQNGEMGP